MSNDSKQILNVGTIVEKTLVDSDGNPLKNRNGDPIVDNDGNPVTLLQIKLRQDVDIYVGGRKVDFSTYTIKGNNGKDVTLENKYLSLTEADLELSRLEERVNEGKVKAETAESIKNTYERDNVLYTVKISIANQA